MKINVYHQSRDITLTCNISKIVHEDVLHDCEAALGVDVSGVGGAGAGEHHDGGGLGAARGGGHNPHVPPVRRVCHPTALELLHVNSFHIIHISQNSGSPLAHSSRFA